MISDKTHDIDFFAFNFEILETMHFHKLLGQSQDCCAWSSVVSWNSENEEEESADLSKSIYTCCKVPSSTRTPMGVMYISLFNIRDSEISI